LTVPQPGGPGARQWVWASLGDLSARVPRER